GDYLRDAGLMLVDGAALGFGVDLGDEQSGHAAGLEPMQRGADSLSVLAALLHGRPGDQVSLTPQDAIGDLVGRGVGLARAAEPVGEIDDDGGVDGGGGLPMRQTWVG